MLECWNSGILGFGNLEEWFYLQKSITKRSKNWTFTSYPIIPSFQYSNWCGTPKFS
jgi:hypothetical protein